MEKRTVRDVPDNGYEGRRVLMRVDFNVPLDAGRVTDDRRIRETLPTIHYLAQRGARTILVSHLGRPKGGWNDAFSLEPAASRLRELLDRPVTFVRDIVGAEAHAAVDALESGAVLVLENVRFLPGEETNDEKLSEQLAAFGEIYVNDAFGTAHRAHASTCGVAEVMKREGRPAVAGFLIEKELRFLGAALARPEPPFVAILGGAKISGKIDVIEALLPRVDHLLIGGAMANTFFRALGLETGKSLVEEDRVDMARGLMERAEGKLVLPVDCMVADAPAADMEAHVVARDEVPAHASILDIGPKSVAAFSDLVESARTVLWNGPMGMFEVSNFAGGTIGIARAAAKATQLGAVTIAGGGDTAAALDAAGLAGRLSHVSTGGGASLEFLEGRVLPGIAVLDDREP